MKEEPTKDEEADGEEGTDSLEDPDKESEGWPFNDGNKFAVLTSSLTDSFAKSLLTFDL